MPVAVRTKGNNPLAHRPNQIIRRGPFSSRRILAIITAAFVSGIGGVRALRLRRASAFAFATAATSTRSTPTSASNFPARGVASTQRAVQTTRSSSRTAMDAAPSSHEVPAAMRGLFAGSGVEGLSHPLLNGRILNLLPDAKKENPKDVRVLYLGTATYDLPLFREKQTARFVDQGCRVSHLDVARDDDGDVDLKRCAAEIERADVLLVGGGNTLYAVDRWHHLGLVPHLRRAMERGCVLAGGSAGAICWFDSGHSDSADPETYRDAMLRKFGDDDGGGGGGADGSSRTEDESSGGYDPTRKKEWRYLRCPGLGFVPGPVVCCPHHDKTQSNGLLRADDFDGMLLARARSGGRSVLGLGIDHYSAFVVEGDDYEVYAIPEKPGSVDAEGRFDVSEDGTPNGKPGVWLKRVIVDDGTDSDDLRVEARVCPPSGKVADLLAYGGDNLPGQNNEERDENQVAVDKCRKENPSGRQL